MHHQTKLQQIQTTCSSVYDFTMHHVHSCHATTCVQSMANLFTAPKPCYGKAHKNA